jgi:hypothetical protein
MSAAILACDVVEVSPETMILSLTSSMPVMHTSEVC